MREGHAVPAEGPSQGQTLHPVASTMSPARLPGQASLPSGTPSRSRSAAAGAVVVVARGAVVVVVDEVVVAGGRVVLVLRVVEVVLVLLVVVLEPETVARHPAAATLWPMRVLTTLPKSRSTFERPPASWWQ